MITNEICNKILDIRKKYYNDNMKWIRRKRVEDLLAEYEKNIEYFVTHNAIVDFDFTNDCFNEEYMNIEDAVLKYVLYRVSSVKKGYQCGEKFKNDNVAKHQMLIDPDSGSMLLQLIYKRLYGNYYENPLFIRFDGNIQGETMNSMQSVLNSYIEQIIEKQNIDYKAIRDEVRGRVSFAFFLELLLRYEDTIAGGLSEVDAQELMKTYHTLGNFIIVPIGCNSPRGTCILKDFWDLTLACIYNWYAGKEKNNDRILKKSATGYVEYNIAMIFTEESDLNRYEDWLEIFKTWEGFVEKNYLGDVQGKINFVEKKDGHFGRPRELWKGHFEGAIMPTTKEEYKEFFGNSSHYIKSRSGIMLENL